MLEEEQLVMVKRISITDNYIHIKTLSIEPLSKCKCDRQNDRVARSAYIFIKEESNWDFFKRCNFLVRSN